MPGGKGGPQGSAGDLRPGRSSPRLGAGLSVGRGGASVGSKGGASMGGEGLPWGGEGLPWGGVELPWRSRGRKGGWAKACRATCPLALSGVQGRQRTEGRSRRDPQVLVGWGAGGWKAGTPSERRKKSSHTEHGFPVGKTSTVGAVDGLGGLPGPRRCPAPPASAPAPSVCRAGGATSASTRGPSRRGYPHPVTHDIPGPRHGDHSLCPGKALCGSMRGHKVSTAPKPLPPSTRSPGMSLADTEIKFAATRGAPAAGPVLGSDVNHTHSPFSGSP